MPEKIDIIPSGALVRTAFIEEILQMVDEEWAPSIDDIPMPAEYREFEGIHAFKHRAGIENSLEDCAVQFHLIKPATPGLLIGHEKYKDYIIYNVLFERPYWVHSTDIIEIKNR